MNSSRHGQSSKTYQGSLVLTAGETFSHKLTRTWNDGASAAHLAYPDRLVALMTLPMLYPDRAIDELNRASKLPGMRGVYLGTNIDNHDLDDPLFEPVFARIEALGLPTFRKSQWPDDQRQNSDPH